MEGFFGLPESAFNWTSRVTRDPVAS